MPNFMSIAPCVATAESQEDQFQRNSEHLVPPIISVPLGNHSNGCHVSLPLANHSNGITRTLTVTEQSCRCRASGLALAGSSFTRLGARQELNTCLLCDDY